MAASSSSSSAGEADNIAGDLSFATLRRWIAWNEVDALTTNRKTEKANIERTLESIKTIGKALVDETTGFEQNEQLLETKALLMENYLKCFEMNLAYDSLVNALMNTKKLQNSGASCEDLMSHFKKEMAEEEKSVSRKRKREDDRGIHQIRQILGIMGDADDDDILVASCSVSYNCPITMAEFKTPVENAPCGHNYEEDAIMELLRNAGGGRRFAPVRCPVTGCRHNVSKSTLKPNPSLLVDMRRARQRDKAARTQQQDDDDVIDL